MKTEFTSEPATITYMPLPNGQADVWLRKNISMEIREAENGTETIWTADEVYFRTSLSQEKIEENFDTIFENGGSVVDEVTGEEVASGITALNRIDALESGVAELAEVIEEALA